MRRNLHFIIPSADFEALDDCDAETDTTGKLYLWGTKMARRRFCRTCGILPWYVPRSNPDGVAITLGCVDWGTGERPGIEIKRYDGLHWEQSHTETGIAAESQVAANAF